MVRDECPAPFGAQPEIKKVSIVVRPRFQPPGHCQPSVSILTAEMRVRALIASQRLILSGISGVSRSFGTASSVLAAGPPPTAPPCAAAALRARRAYATDPAWEHVKRSFTSIKVEVGSDGIATITLNRPEQLNALNRWAVAANAAVASLAHATSYLLCLSTSAITAAR